MDIWNLAALKDRIEQLYGRPQREAITPSLNSIFQRCEFAKYHYREANRLLDAATVPHEKPGKIMMLLLGGDEASQAFNESRFQASAHITACIQSMHATADILAHTVYFARGMNLTTATTLKPHLIGLKKIVGLLPNGPIQEQIITFLNHEDFIYLSAVNNHSKHRSVVDTPYSLNFTDDHTPCGLKFSSFEYDRELFEERWAMPTLKKEYARQSQLIIGIGLALNAELNI